MPGKNTIKFINSLQQKKIRQQQRLFIIEGEKTVGELLGSSLAIHSIYATGEWLEEYQGNLPGKETGLPVVQDRSEGGTEQGAFKLPGDNFHATGNFPVYRVNEQELKRISSLNTPNKVLAVVHTPSPELDPESLTGSLTIVLDNIQDPGNLGTLIRSADWFGVENIILSENSAEVTSPKVVQATMGSILRVRTFYTDLPSFLESPQISQLPVFGAFTDAPDIYSVPLEERGLIVLGNESRGISRQVEKLVTQRFSIPSFRGKGRLPESLNMAVAGSIILSEFRRRSRR
jgi:RNA methyltransferase, TrmH family